MANTNRISSTKPVDDKYGMSVPAIISAGAAAAGSLFGLFTQNNANKDNMRFQRQENARNRNFQREMADYAYQKNLEQWNRENEYNSPIETRKRLKNAGLNPDLFYGGGAGNMVSADSPMMSAPSGTGGVSPAVRPISADTHALDLEMRRAQIDNIRADTDEKTQEALHTSIKAAIDEGLKDFKITVGGIEVDLKKNEKALSDMDVEERRRTLEGSITYLNARSEHLLAEIDNITADTSVKRTQAETNRLNNLFISASFHMRLREIALRNKLAVEEIKATAANVVVAYMNARSNRISALAADRSSKAYSEFMDVEKINAAWRTHINKASLANVKIEGARMLFDLEQEKDWQDFERGLKATGEIVGSICDVVTTAKGGVNLHLNEMTSTSGKDPVTGNKWTHSWYNYGK